MSSVRGGTRWSYCAYVISRRLTSQSVTCAQTWQGWAYRRKLGWQHHIITLHSYLHGQESKYVLVITDWTHGYCLLECCYGANDAIIFPSQSFYLVMRRIMLHPRCGSACELPQPESVEAVCVRFSRAAHWERPKPADKQPSGSVTEWCITAPLGGLTRIRSCV